MKSFDLSQSKNDTQPLDTFINTTCRPDNWGDVSGFVQQPKSEQPGSKYSIFLLCMHGHGKLGPVKVKTQEVNVDTPGFEKDFVKNATLGIYKMVLLGFRTGNPYEDKNLKDRKDVVYYITVPLP
jgi:hypothetical protein